MRKLRVVVSGMGTALPALVVTVLGPTIDACGSNDAPVDAGADGQTVDVKGDVPSDGVAFGDVASSDAAPDVVTCPQGECTYTVPIPPAGTFPDLASVCVAAPPVVSNTAATVTLSNFDAQALTADGFISIKPELLAAMIGDPVVAISPNTMSVQLLTKTAGGYSFKATWSSVQPNITATVTFQVACGDAGIDAGVQTVESTTDLELCGVSAPQAWESSGSNCIQCCVVCEMAPTPIVSDNHGDELPLARALRLRVIELARAGRQVLLFAQNDAGPDAEYEWRVSGGSVERVADDVVLWTLPEQSDAAPFGQLAVWNDDGAIVENFYWGAA